MGTPDCTQTHLYLPFWFDHSARAIILMIACQKEEKEGREGRSSCPVPFHPTRVKWRNRKKEQGAWGLEMEYSNGGRDTWKSYLCLRLLIWALSSWCQADRASVISAGLQALESSVLSGEEDRERWKYNMGQERLIFMSSIPVVPFHILSDRNRTTFNPVHHHQTHVWKQSSLSRHILSYIKSDSKERRLRGNSPLTFFYGYGLIDRQILWIRWRERERECGRTGKESCPWRTNFTHMAEHMKTPFRW